MARWRLAVGGDVPVQVVDDGGVEDLLLLERRADQPPDEPAQPPLERSVERRWSLGQRVPRLVDRGELVLVVGRRRVRHVRHALDRAVERGQRGVVGAVRLVALALEPRQSILETFLQQVSAPAPVTPVCRGRYGTRAVIRMNHGAHGGWRVISVGRSGVLETKHADAGPQAALGGRTGDPHAAARPGRTYSQVLPPRADHPSRLGLAEPCGPMCGERDTADPELATRIALPAFTAFMVSRDKRLD